IAGDNDIFCTECGTRIERPAKEPVKSKSKIKYIAAVLAVVIIIAAISGIVSHKKLMDDVETILGRELFVYDEAALLYRLIPSYNIQNLNLSVSALSENWKIGQILNKDNFYDISWSLDEEYEDLKIITFKGSPQNAKVETLVVIKFVVSKNGDTPLAVDFEETTEDGPTNKEKTILNRSFTYWEMLEKAGNYFDVPYIDIQTSCCILTYAYAGEQSKEANKPKQILSEQEQEQVASIIDYTKEPTPFHDPAAVMDAVNGAAFYTNYSNKTYGALISQAMQDYPDYEYNCYYTLYDMDRNGIPELFLRTGTCEADYVYNVYTILPDEGEVYKMGQISGGHNVLAGIGEAGSILVHFGHQGSESIVKYTYENGQFSTKLLYENYFETGDYASLDTLPCFELDNLSALNAREIWGNQDYSRNDSLLQQLCSEKGTGEFNIAGRWVYAGCYDWYENDHDITQPITEPLVYDGEQLEIIFYEDFTCTEIINGERNDYTWSKKDGWYNVETGYAFYGVYPIDSDTIHGMEGDGPIMVYKRAS
ncbi:MAG: hypothetical protein IJC24_07135, partial [Clostridia bacterium]|nr:hypothetical protein [Clostridia bacterium]